MSPKIVEAERLGWRLSAASWSALARYGGLTVGEHGSGVNMVTYTVTVDPCLAMTDRTPDETWPFRVALFPFGATASKGCSFDPLYIAANGAVILDAVVVMYVRSVAEIFEAQVSGVNLWQPAPPGLWARYGDDPL